MAASEVSALMGADAATGMGAARSAIVCRDAREVVNLLGKLATACSRACESQCPANAVAKNSNRSLSRHTERPFWTMARLGGDGSPSAPRTPLVLPATLRGQAPRR